MCSISVLFYKKHSYKKRKKADVNLQLAHAVFPPLTSHLSTRVYSVPCNIVAPGSKLQRDVLRATVVLQLLKRPEG